MKRIDLEEGRFRQQDVLRMIPSLSERTLLNWVERGVIDSSQEPLGSGTPRLYTALGVIMLAFIARVVDLGIKPSAARNMAEDIAEHALKLHKALPPAEERDGQLAWIFDDKKAANYHRAYIYRYGHHDYQIRIKRGSLVGVARSIAWEVYIVVEVDLLIIGTLNIIYAVIGANPLPSRIR